MQILRTTMRYDRARATLYRHPNCILAAFMASATWCADSGMVGRALCRRVVPVRPVRKLGNEFVPSIQEAASTTPYGCI